MLVQVRAEAPPIVQQPVRRARRWGIAAGVTGALALAAALVVGLVVGALQAMTQMHDPVVGQVPRLLAVSLAVLVVMPWLLSRWIAFAVEMIGSIPERL